jgi:hypothetical protein
MVDLYTRVEVMLDPSSSSSFNLLPSPLLFLLLPLRRKGNWEIIKHI